MVTSAALALAGASLTQAATTPHKTKHKLVETETQTMLSRSGDREVFAGVLDGKIGGKPVHGATRAVATFASASSGSGDRFEFDARGSRHAKLTFNVVSNGDGTITDSGSGHWVGGTGAYRGASGRFTFTGKAPASSPTITVVFNGNIKY